MKLGFSLQWRAFRFSSLRDRSLSNSLQLARACDKISGANFVAKSAAKDEREEGKGGYQICQNLIFQEDANRPLRRERFWLKKKKRKGKKKKQQQQLIFLQVLTISLSAMGIGIKPLSKERKIRCKSILLLLGENLDRVTETETSYFSLCESDNSVDEKGQIEAVSQKGACKKKPIFPISLHASTCNPLKPKNENALDFENKMKLLNPEKTHYNNSFFPLETSALLSDSDNSLNFENVIEPISQKGGGKMKPVFPIALQASSNPLLPKNENALDFENKLKLSNLEKAHHNKLVFLSETSATLSNSQNSLDVENVIESISQKEGSKKKFIFPISLLASSNPLLPKNENSLDFKNSFKPLNPEETHHSISVFLPETYTPLSDSENSLDFENTIKPTFQNGAARKKPTFLEISDLPLQKGENSLHKTCKPLSPRKEEFQHKSLFREVSSLKRRRPTRLSLTSSDLIKTPSGLLPPHEVKNKDMGEKNIHIEGPNYGVVCKKGRRQIMEDIHAVTSIHCGDSKQDFFAICDGHGGRDAVEFVARNLPQNIAKAFSASSQVMEEEKEEKGKGAEEDAIKTAISSSYLATDQQFLQQQVGSGASCVSVVVQKKSLIVANAGDCRAVLSRAGKAEALSCDHRAEREDERQRIEKMGGYVDCFNGVWRVQGTLAVTRGFGDRQLKEWISPEPEIKMLPLESNCEFIILASDGLWDKVSNEEAVECARMSLKEEEVDGRVATACKRLVEMATRRGSLDDISVMIIDLEVYLCS